MTTITAARSLPNSLQASLSGLSAKDAERLAIHAVIRAQRTAPKSSGRGAQHLTPFWGEGFYGIRWAEPYIWYQEQGIKAFTMRSLSGRVIPMWVNDHDGSEAAKIPAKDRSRRTRTDAAGKRQVLIFRKAARQGARKMAMRHGTMVSVPASYPGAPGRIAARTVTDGRNTGRIASRVRGIPHVGVRWRFPGLVGRGFMHQAIMVTAVTAHLPTPVIQAMYREVR